MEKEEKSTIGIICTGGEEFVIVGAATGGRRKDEETNDAGSR